MFVQPRAISFHFNFISFNSSQARFQFRAVKHKSATTADVRDDLQQQLHTTILIAIVILLSIRSCCAMNLTAVAASQTRI